MEKDRKTKKQYNTELKAQGYNKKARKVMIAKWLEVSKKPTKHKREEGPEEDSKKSTKRKREESPDEDLQKSTKRKLEDIPADESALAKKRKNEALLATILRTSPSKNPVLCVTLSLLIWYKLMMVKAVIARLPRRSSLDVPTSPRPSSFRSLLLLPFYASILAIPPM